MKTTLLIISVFLVSGCTWFTKTGTTPLHVDSYYLTPCDGAEKLPERPVTAIEVQSAHAKTVQALTECSKKQAGAAAILKGLSEK